MSSIRDFHEFLDRAAECIQQPLIVITRGVGVGVAADDERRNGDFRRIKMWFGQRLVSRSTAGERTKPPSSPDLGSDAR